MVMHVCTHTQTHMHAYTHTHMLAYMHAHTHTHTSRTAWRDEFWEIISKTTACWLTERSRQMGKFTGEEGWGVGGRGERNRNCVSFPTSHFVFFFPSESFCLQALLPVSWNQLTNPVIIFVLLLLPCLLCTNSEDSIDPDKRAAWWRKIILVTLRATFSNTLYNNVVLFYVLFLQIEHIAHCKAKNRNTVIINVR